MTLRSDPIMLWILWATTATQLYWALTLVIVGHPILTTTLAPVIHFCGGWFQAAMTLVIVAALSAAGLTASFMSPLKRLALVLPQLAMLWISTTGAIEAIVNQRYGDMVIRPWYFISDDQVVWVSFALAQTVAIAWTFVIQPLRDRRGA